MKNPFIREALLYEKLGESNVRCLCCERKCLIKEGQLGFCRTRKNSKGILKTLIFGNISSLSCNPIEKKPFFHFYPGSLALTAGSFSCNFTCPWCQNWDISKSEVKEGDYLSPQHFVSLAKSYNCQGTSISFNEPTLLLEWILEVFKLAKERALYNTLVTNGYMSEKALSLLIESGLDALNVDIKGSKKVVRKYCQADLDLIWRNCEEAKKRGVHLELTTLVIPSVNDDKRSIEEITSKILSTLGKDIPYHLTRYYPHYQFKEKPTPIKTLEKAYSIAREKGLEYTYIGNVPGHKYENTYCPSCGQLLIKRYIFDLKQINLDEGRCPNCGKKITGRLKPLLQQAVRECKIVGVQFIEPEKYIGNGLDKSSPYNELKWSGSDLGLGFANLRIL
ncbi:MAG: AmmeMemoRadiSam system radical SAM enzyme [Armatimonadetes bacterium CG07_land_8_20_14_0_80_40_9]|nr:MAG: AmmeMemoRadiSam system radical SAM enzyme [Armatimonadetes bacterium CG07_land_8_20_14_0_80_40_9]